MRTPPRLLAAVIAALLIGGASGCERAGSSTDEPAPSRQPAPEPQPEPEPEPPKKDVAELIRGDAPTLPPELDGVEPGMTRADVEQRVPDMTREGLLLLEGYQGRVYVNLSFDPANDRLTRIWFSLPADRGRDLVSKAWGDPIAVEEYGDDKQVWFAPEAGLRAALSQGGDDDVELVFTAYMPAERMIGEGAPAADEGDEGDEGEDEQAAEPVGVPFAFEADHPLLDATVESLRKDWPRALGEHTAEQTAERLEEIEELTGRELEPSLEPAARVYLDLPPTEYGTFFTRVLLQLDGEGEVVAYRFGLSYASRPEAADELLALLKARLGEPEETERHGEQVLVFRGEGPRVEARRDEAAQWVVTVRETGSD